MNPSLSKTWKRFGLLLTALAMVAGQVGAQEPSPGVLRVGTTNAPPFAWKADDGKWFGISIELWRELAAELGWEFQLHERKFTDLLKDVEDGSLDVGVAAITITPDREAVMDFTHPFYISGLGIAVPQKSAVQGWLNVAERFFTIHFLYVLAALILVLIIAGCVVWLFERRSPEMFGGGAARGVGSGIWWSAVTMTTVGYGDKAPRTLGGRIVAIIWMFASIIILSSFTAAITSSLTISELGGTVKGVADLKAVRVGTVEETTSATFLEDQGIVAASFSGTSVGLRALADGEVDAFVEDAPIMQYLINSNFRGQLQVLPQTFDRQYYGIALPSGSNLREPLNRALLRFIQSEDWRSLVERGLGN
jgi:polar amino acid transport system substrate-binding protein